MFFDLSRDSGYVTRLVPFVMTLIFALVSIVPLNLPGFAVVTPAFTLMAVFHWTVYRPDLLPLSAVFVSGLFLDLLNGTPYVGLSALIFLLARTAVMAQRQLFVNRTFPVLWLGFLGVAAGTFALLWVLVCLLHGGFVGLRPFIFEAVLTVACYPVGSYILALAQRALLART
ncbi:MAG TPA: rod shape-determining protein MreD [Stellaceae bacterium]|nr:rod shape-determining protein MreD [Stellaceae bacterium]